MAKTTALYPLHQELGASFTDFGGWEMPLRYTSDLAEHAAVREAVGIFDLSHMGEVYVRGEGAGEFLDYALVGKYSAMTVGRAKYALIVNERGGIIDDLIVYRLGEGEYLVVPNAANAPRVAAELTDRAAGRGVEVVDATADAALIAVQGPQALAVLRQLTPAGDVLEALKYYACARVEILGEEMLVGRTGYTGEDGFEVWCPNAKAPELFRALLAVESPVKPLPCGLAARDTLRLEAAMPLYGHELKEELTPFDVGFGKVVNFEKGDFFARDALEVASGNTPARVRVHLVGEGRRAARAGYAVQDESGQEIGEVTSGVLSPTLGYPIAIAYVDRDFATEGRELTVDLRGKPLPMKVVSGPFYSRPRN